MLIAVEWYSVVQSEYEGKGVGAGYIHLFTFLSESLLILSILMSWVFAHQHLDSQQLQA